MTMTATWFRPRATGGTTLILLTMSLGVLIAQIDTSVVNLAVKEIGASLNAGLAEDFKVGSADTRSAEGKGLRCDDAHMGHAWNAANASLHFVE